MEIDFKHKQAAHCENGVVANLMTYNGFTVSEPMVFGIGSGLLFTYIPFLKVNHAPVVSYRAMPGIIFTRFAKRVGIKIKREKFRNTQTAKARLDENLQKNNPVGLQVGVYNLPYFPDEYRFHFNAHNMVVYGKTDGIYLIRDPVMETVTFLTEKAIIKGIKHTCRDMLAPVPVVGVKGIRKIAKLIRKWPKAKGIKIANHYLGQIVRMQEEIGTGGGGFRYIYAAFLQEAGKLLTNSQLLELSNEMTLIGDQWRDFAVEASRIYKNRSNTVAVDQYDHVATLLEDIANKEEVFFKKLKKAI